LPSLLPICRDLSSAQNELRWLGEHAAEVASKQGLGKESRLLQRFVNRRARGEPLQYILGTEFFGELEIKCRPGVLIPRWVGLNVAFHKMFVLMFDFI
jgi:methylase of polypeptide subunit release factors